VVAHRQQVAAQGLHQRGLPGTLHHPRQLHSRRSEAKHASSSPSARE
jgi:hypothetical protein